MVIKPINDINPASFRDPSGFIYKQSGTVYRQVNLCYKNIYEYLKKSRLLENLQSQGLLVEHEEVDLPVQQDSNRYLTLKPREIPFISYPYEWCFSQLKDAALLTLKIAKLALDQGTVLKDASAYNIQFIGYKPILIDTLSFDIYKEGAPWVAYNQFCKHFLNPLLLMANVDYKLGQLSRLLIDGIDTDLTKTLLPKRALLNPNVLAHVYVKNSVGQRIQQNNPHKKEIVYVSRKNLAVILTSLQDLISGLQLKQYKTVWRDYYERNNNYADSALEYKERFVLKALSTIKPNTVWDLGANNGLFSNLCEKRSESIVSFDIDFMAVEDFYNQNRQNKVENILPLLMDLTNPSPQLGWANSERMSLLQRGPCDLSLSLALIHHLAIGNNVPLNKVASFTADVSKHAVVEFIPKEDSNAQKLLANREDIFSDYTEDGFENAFCRNFDILAKEQIPYSKRTLYLMRSK